jgi:ribose transport system substrate-binding protein
MSRQRPWLLAALIGAVALTACTKTDSKGGDQEQPPTAQPPAAAPAAQPPAGDRKIKIAFSAPGADHGWLAAFTKNARDEAKRLDGVELEVSEGATDAASQAAQVDTLIAGKPDVLVILPYDGAALTPTAQAAMAAGIPVVNVDREFASPGAYRTWIGGDNYGIGFSAGNYIADQLACKGKVVEIQGIPGISVTELRTKGFTDAIQRCKGGIEVVARQPADFLPDKGLQVMEALLSAHPKIDAVYTHDDDMAMGVVAAIQNAGRDKDMFVTGAGGSAKAMELIQAGGLYRATFLYSPIMAASGIRLAHLIATNKGLSDLVEPDVPSRIQVRAAAVTKDNVAQFVKFGY